MSETNPSNSVLDALSGTTDAQTGVVYPTKGSMPWYTAFYQLICRLLKVSTRANDLRAFKDGTLTFGVAAGTWYNGDTAVSYAGAAAQALTNNATNYVYLTAAGALTVNTSGFPTPSTAPHIPLAIIPTGTASLAGTTGLYDFADIVDCRGMGFLTPAGNSPTPASVSTQIANQAGSITDTWISFASALPVGPKIYIDTTDRRGMLPVSVRISDTSNSSIGTTVSAVNADHWPNLNGYGEYGSGATNTTTNQEIFNWNGYQIMTEASTGQIYLSRVSADTTMVYPVQIRINIIWSPKKPINDISYP